MGWLQVFNLDKKKYYNAAIIGKTSYAVVVTVSKIPGATVTAPQGSTTRIATTSPCGFQWIDPKA